MFITGKDAVGLSLGSFAGFKLTYTDQGLEDLK